MRAQIAERESRLAAAGSACGVLAVASGDGVRRLYTDLGATVIDGGPTMNPSTDELLAGIHSVGAEGVLVMPNSPNVVLAAERAVELSGRDAHVLDCTSQQAGLAVLVELDPDSPVERNVATLGEALAEVREGAVAPAARDDAQGRFVRGDAVGFVGGEIVAWGGAGSTLSATLRELAEGCEIVTILEGEGAPVPIEEVAALAPPGAEAEVHAGGQPNYWWLLAAQ